ncbi:MAG: carboxypeptidase-like regulatory domain-containing protein [Pyrinomonadaceae bacterium]
MLNCTRSILVLFVLLASSAPVALAQTGTSRISGRVVDTKEASVPGASVTVTNEATGLSQTQTTNECGVYAFASLPVGISR